MFVVDGFSKNKGRYYEPTTEITQTFFCYLECCRHQETQRCWHLYNKGTYVHLHILEVYSGAVPALCDLTRLEILW